MLQDLPIEKISIDPIANGNIVRVSMIDKDADDTKDRWIAEEFYFNSNDEVLAFLETNLD